MPLIKLTLRNNRPKWVNPETVEFAMPNDDGTCSIKFVDGEYETVKETPEQINTLEEEFFAPPMVDLHGLGKTTVVQSMVGTAKTYMKLGGHEFLAGNTYDFAEYGMDLENFKACVSDGQIALA